jgi:UDP-N-acetylmuramate dehydrogenase
VLGAGYNLLFTCDFDGMVIKPAMRGMQLINENAEFVEIEAGAAEPWDPFIGQSVAM